MENLQDNSQMDTWISKRQARQARFGDNLPQTDTNDDLKFDPRDPGGIKQKELNLVQQIEEVYETAKKKHIYGSLDAEIKQDPAYRRDNYRDNRGLGEQTAYQVKEKYETYKMRLQRFGKDFLNKQQERDIKIMENKIQWSEHKAPPIPILRNSQILTDSLFLYGVDYMSTLDVQKYFKSYCQENLQENQWPIIKWINDSSCVVQLPSEAYAEKAFNQLKLSEPRIDDCLPPLTLFLEDYNTLQKQEFDKKVHNPNYDDLFGECEAPQKDEFVYETLDERNSDPRYCFRDVIGYRIQTKATEPTAQGTVIDPKHRLVSQGMISTWQNLWLRYATTSDQKSKNTLGKDSRYYKFIQEMRNRIRLQNQKPRDNQIMDNRSKKITKNRGERRNRQKINQESDSTD